MGRAPALGTLALMLASCSAIPSSRPEPGAPAAQAPAPSRLPHAAAEAAPPRILIQGVPAQGALLTGTAPATTTLLTLDGDPVPVAADRRFLIGFGRDAAPQAVLQARLADGRTVREMLSVAPRAWDVQSLPTLRRGTTPTPEFVRRRATETAQINAARAQRSATEGWRQGFIWPVTGRISGVFGSQRIYAGEAGAPHSGVDIARPTGTPVVAPADGVVVLAAATPFTLEGHLLMIDHGLGLNSAFLHLSRIDVKVGDTVRQGQPVGAIGTTGRSTGPHLHWAMMLRGTRIDAQRVVGPMPAG